MNSKQRLTFILNGCKQWEKKSLFCVSATLSCCHYSQTKIRNYHTTESKCRIYSETRKRHKKSDQIFSRLHCTYCITIEKNQCGGLQATEQSRPSTAVIARHQLVCCVFVLLSPSKNKRHQTCLINSDEDYWQDQFPCIQFGSQFNLLVMLDQRSFTLKCFPEYFLL